MITMAKKRHLLLAAAVAVAAVEGVAAQQNPDLKWAQMHGWLMWTSFGFLFPISLLLIRYSRPQRDSTATVAPGRVQRLFYLHVFMAVMGVVMASAGVSILIHRNVGNFDYTHQRLGLTLMIIMWTMPFIGLLRPAKGVAARPYWFVLHWVFGTGAVFLGVVNCYLGIHAYQLVFQRNIRSLNIAFSCILAFMAVAYFFQDKWSYILKQRNSPDCSHATGVKVSQIGLV
ncbi:unnamed protein product [Calypogeia fissa]